MLLLFVSVSAGPAGEFLFFSISEADQRQKVCALWAHTEQMHGHWMHHLHRAG